jgi:hypothetical protein
MPALRLAWPSGKLPAAFGAVVVGGLVLLPAWTVASTWLERKAQARQWAIAGPACPALPAPPPHVRGHRTPQYFEYRGVDFGRQEGQVSCAAPPDGNPLSPASYTVCQFTAPDLLLVKSDAGESVFQPGPHRPATVTVRHGQVTCVLGGWFKG